MGSYVTDEGASENVAAIGRVVVELGGDLSYRLTEQDGRLVHSWLPGFEDDTWLPTDCGGFDDQHDAVGYALAIDLVRAEHRMIDVSPEQIEQERERLDAINAGPTPRINPERSLRRFVGRIRDADDAGSLEAFASRALQRMREPESYPVQHHPASEPVIEHRTLRRAV
jgi:hypothetical protein